MRKIDNVRGSLPIKPTRFMDKLRVFIRAQNLAYKTEKTYCLWVKRYIRYHKMQHPEEMQAAHVEQFLHHLAVVENVTSRP